MEAIMTVKVEKTAYGGWKNCYRIYNEKADLIVTSDVGPRIIRFGFIGGPNEFCEIPDHMGKTGGNEWRNYGGHRLWHSPEEMPRCYFPDNFPVDVEIIPNGVRVSQPVETTTLIKKDMEVTLDDDSAVVTVKHQLTNKGMWDVELAAWALSVMAPLGLEIVPQEQLDTHLLPNRMISLWPYSDMNDARVQWGKKYIYLKQDMKAVKPFKFGISDTNGWAAYLNHGNMFVKRFSPEEECLYPDYSASMYETYTCDFMTEMETLSPLNVLGPNESLLHVEEWNLFKDVKVPKDEEETDKLVKKYIR